MVGPVHLGSGGGRGRRRDRLPDPGHPVELYESLLVLGAAALVSRLRPRYPAATALAVYAGIRLGVDFFRTGPRCGPCTANQWLALAALGAVVVWLKTRSAR
ncbi:MAG: hypothetical protein HY319_18250 [Armatimonadetes bacterium]|nr:hypothetical protein [Armatimonadota bacterium]